MWGSSERGEPQGLKSRVSLIWLLMLWLMFAPGCRRGTTGGLSLAGSTSVEPFAELLAEEYMLEHPQALPVNVQGGGSTAGIQAAQMGVADIGMASRELRPEEKGLNGILIAQDAIAIIVNPQNPLTEISSEELRGIFAGRIRNWQDMGWKPRVITVVTREEGSGTRGAFDKLVMGVEDVTPSAIVQDSNGAVRAIVADDPYAVGYISLGLVNEEVKALRVDGVEATAESAARGEYRLVRPFLFLTRGEPEGQAEEFIEFVLSPRAQELLASEGLSKVRG